MSEVSVTESGSHTEAGTRLQNFLDRAGLRGFPWKTAIILYTISWGWLFIVHDSYWAADWENFVFPDLSTFEFDTLGFAPWMKANLILFDFLGPSFMRLLIFLGFFSAGICLYGISRKVYFLSFTERKTLTLLFLVLPFNTARVSLMVFHYSEAYFLFFFGWYLLVTFRSLAIKHCCIILFFLSFQMHSILVFYLLPIAHLFFLSKTRSLKEHFRWLLNNCVLLILPFLYWTLRNLFWPEQVPYHAVTSSQIGGSIVLPVFVFVAVLGLYLWGRRSKLENQHSVWLLSLGTLALFLGIYPYILYGFFTPETMLSKYFYTFLGRTSWYTRHQTLEPLGLSLIITGGVKYISDYFAKALQLFRHLVLFLCVVLNAGFGFEHVVDYKKQQEIIVQLKLAGEVKLKSHMQFIDQTTALNARGQTMYYRAWSGLIGLANGLDEARRVKIETICVAREGARLVLIEGPETHWQALKNWVGDGEMGFKVTVDDTPGACKPEMVKDEKVSGAIPILFFFTGAKG